MRCTQMVFQIWRQLVLIAIGMLIGCGQGWAAAPEKRVALVIGNNDYRTVTKLDKATNDAKAVGRELTRLGFEVISVSNVSQKRMNQVINEFSQKVSGGGVGVFFFAGHGMQINNQNFLLPVDFELPNDANDVADQSISLQSIQDKLADAKARFSLLVIDACRDNPLPKKAGRSLAVSRGLAAPSAPNGQVVLFSAGAHQQALDKLSDDDNNPNGLFTREFIPLISTPGLSVTDALKRVRSSVTRKAKAIGHEQNPALYDQTDGDFFFVAGAAPGNTKAATQTETIQRIDPMAVELSFWESIKGSDNNEDFRAYLNKYPDGQFIELAQSRLRRAFNSGDKSGGTTRGSAGKEDCADCPEMVDIPPGEFLMGAARNEVDSGDHERPRHSVKIPNAFAASRHEITVRQFTAFVDATGHKAEGSCNVWSGSNWENQPGKSWRDPGFSQTGTHPVVCVSWNDARAYTSWLSRLTGKHYRLPTESEWEYMARGGTRTSRFWGDDPALACEFANVHDATTQSAHKFAWEPHECKDGFAATAPVGRFKANPFGLHDTAGNAWEWVEDCFNTNYVNAPNDGSARVTDDCGRRVYRGGGWSGPSSVRSATRTGNPPSYRSQLLGFRVVRALD